MQIVAPKWPTLWKALNLKIYGPIPWLAIVPVAAWILATANHFIGASVRLPAIVVLSFVGAFLFWLAHCAYAYGCPEAIRRIGSEEEWAIESAKRREQINEELKRAAALDETLNDSIDSCVREGLQSLTGEDAFTAEGILVIRNEMRGAVRERTTILPDHIERLKQLTTQSYRELVLANNISRLACTTLIILAALPFGYVIFERAKNIWSVAW